MAIGDPRCDRMKMTRALSQPRQAWKEMTAKCYMVSWIRKRILGKKQGTPNKVWTLVNRKMTNTDDVIVTTIHYW